ncbi:hypothetical protein LAC02_00210 [Ligilactobacillus acidipiscis]|nr:hypothetical protein LAC02_00210 [Ligilactobacillus acidipiscis]
MKSFPTEKIIGYFYIVFYYTFFMILRMRFLNPKAVDSQSIVNPLTKVYFFNHKKFWSMMKR